VLHHQPRLHPEQLAYICNHAEDQYLLFDFCFLPLVEPSRRTARPSRLRSCSARPTACRPDQDPNLLCYEDLLAAHHRTLAATRTPLHTVLHIRHHRQPKGALYSHRSTVLHAYASALPNVLNVSSRDT
jgi:fatty-acyl-CoA synthase